MRTQPALHHRSLLRMAAGLCYCAAFGTLVYGVALHVRLESWAETVARADAMAANVVAHAFAPALIAVDVRCGDPPGRGCEAGIAAASLLQRLPVHDPLALYPLHQTLAWVPDEAAHSGKSASLPPRTGGKRTELAAPVMIPIASIAPTF